MTRKSTVQRLLALMLLAVLPTLSGAIPILDMMVGDWKAAVEAEHHRDTHGFPHNHLICIQHEASQSIPGCDVPLPLVLATLGLPAFPNVDSWTFSSQTLLNRARAPPSA